MITHRIPDNARVKLRDGIEADFYDGLGLPGNEGWVRQHQTDRYGPSRVYIQWDQDHWSYNGAKDRWGWEDHFEVVEEHMSDKTNKQEQVKALMNSFGDALADILEEENSSVSPPPDPLQSAAQEKDDSPSFDEVVQAASESLNDLESFIVLGIRKQQNDEGNKVIFPVIYNAAKDRKTALLLQLHLSQIAANFQEQLVGESLREAIEDE